MEAFSLHMMQFLPFHLSLFHSELQVYLGPHFLQSLSLQHSRRILIKKLQHSWQINLPLHLAFWIQMLNFTPVEGLLTIQPLDAHQLYLAQRSFMGLFLNKLDSYPIFMQKNLNGCCQSSLKLQFYRRFLKILFIHRTLTLSVLNYFKSSC